MSPLVCSHGRRIAAGAAASHNRPTANSNTGGFYGGTPANAYDTSANSVDTTTSTGVMGPGSVSFSAFQGTGFITGTLNVRVLWGWSADGTTSIGSPGASQIQYSTDNGSNWTSIGSLTTSMATYTVALTAVDISQVLVKSVCFSNVGGSVKLGTDYMDNGYVDISDIVIL